MALAHITEDDFTELLREEAEDVFTDGRVVQGQGIGGGLIYTRDGKALVMVVWL